MKTVLRYNNINLMLYGDYSITKGSQNVEYSDLNCDFTGHSKEDLPEKYQEVQIIDINDYNQETLLFIGYVDTYKFPQMREIDEELNMTISLYTPKKMTTVRTCIANGTYQLIDLIQNTILEPLIDDGFIIKEIDIADHQVSVNYIAETIEYCMNNLSNKFNFWWYIDENKGIYIKDISKMIDEEPDFNYDNSHFISGLQYIEPTTSSEGYANVVNFKNVRIYELANANNNPLLTLPTGTIKANDTIDFNYPIDIKSDNIIKSAKSNAIMGDVYYGLYIEGTYSNGNNFTAYIKVDNGTYNQSSNIGFDGVDGATQDILLIRDSFFSNLITGFKFNNSDYNISSINIIYSQSALIWNVNKFYNDSGIMNKKNKISSSGIVEVTIDMNESWKTIQELTEIGASYLTKNSLYSADEIQMKLDKNIFEIGKTIYINKMIIEGTYIITKIKQNYSKNDIEYIVTAKNGNLLNNFIDVFRGETTEESSDKTYQVYITHYVEEEIAERFEVVQ